MFQPAASPPQDGTVLRFLSITKPSGRDRVEEKEEGKLEPHSFWVFSTRRCLFARASSFEVGSATNSDSNQASPRKLVSQKALLAQHTAQSEAPFFSQAPRPIHETTSHLHGADWQKGSPKEQFEQTKGQRGMGRVRKNEAEILGCLDKLAVGQSLEEEPGFGTVVHCSKARTFGEGGRYDLKERGARRFVG